jgi:hypothetical protein
MPTLPAFVGSFGSRLREGMVESTAYCAVDCG